MLETLLGVIGVLLGGVIYLKVKKDSAESLNENVDVKNKAGKLDAEVEKSKALLEAEEEKRKALASELSKEKGNKSNEELAKFFNDPSDS